MHANQCEPTPTHCGVYLLILAGCADVCRDDTTTLGTRFMHSNCQTTLQTGGCAIDASKMAIPGRGRVWSRDPPRSGGGILSINRDFIKIIVAPRPIRGSTVYARPVSRKHSNGAALRVNRVADDARDSRVFSFLSAKQSGARTVRRQRQR